MGPVRTVVPVGEGQLGLELGSSMFKRGHAVLQIGVFGSQAGVGSSHAGGASGCKHGDGAGQDQPAAVHSSLAGSCSTTRSIRPYSSISCAESHLLRSQSVAMVSYVRPVPSA